MRLPELFHGYDHFRSLARFGDVAERRRARLLSRLMTEVNNGNIGIGLSTSIPGQKLHIGYGHILLEGGVETSIQFKRGGAFSEGESGTSATPIFQIGRVQAAGDGDPEFRVLYEDDEAWSIFLGVNSLSSHDKTEYTYYAWPVRGGH